MSQGLGQAGKGMAYRRGSSHEQGAGWAQPLASCRACQAMAAALPGAHLCGALLGDLVLQAPHAVLVGQTLLGHAHLGQDAHLGRGRGREGGRALKQGLTGRGEGCYKAHAPGPCGRAAATLGS